MKYKVISLIAGGFSECPPKFTAYLFPAFAGEMVEIKEDEAVITFAGETQVNPLPGLIVQKFNPQSNSWETI
jgi:hypothetical protein